MVQFSSNPMVEWMMSKMNLIREACCQLAIGETVGKFLPPQLKTKLLKVFFFTFAAMATMNGYGGMKVRQCARVLPSSIHSRVTINQRILVSAPPQWRLDLEMLMVN